MKRKLLKSYGLRGNRRANVYKTGPKFVVERYLEGGKPKRKSFTTREQAEAYARAYANANPTAPTPLTLRDAFQRFLDTESAKHNWRPSTRTNYANHRKRIEESILPDTLVTTIGRAHLDTLWLKLREGKPAMAHTQVVAKVNLVKRLMTWLADRDLAVNKIASWEAPKAPRVRIAEYLPEETDKILAQWDYLDGWEWRPWAITMIAHTNGFRANALVHLERADIDWGTGRVKLQLEHDKTKKEWSRPLTWESLSAIKTALWHAERLGKTSRWVFYGKGDEPYTYQAYWKALQKAEKAAGVTHVRGRAAHGFRRQASNDARRATGDAALGMLWIGDTDLRQAASYIREREEEMDALANRGAR